MRVISTILCRYHSGSGIMFAHAVVKHYESDPRVCLICNIPITVIVFTSYIGMNPTVSTIVTSHKIIMMFIVVDSNLYQTIDIAQPVSDR